MTRINETFLKYYKDHLNFWSDRTWFETNKLIWYRKPQWASEENLYPIHLSILCLFYITFSFWQETQWLNSHLSKKKKKKQRLEGKIMIIILLLALKMYYPNSVTDTGMYLCDRDKCVCCMHMPLAALHTQGGLYWSTLWWIRYWHLSVLKIHRTQHQGGWRFANSTQGIQDLSIWYTLSPSLLRMTCCSLKAGSATNGKLQIWWDSFLYIQ